MEQIKPKDGNLVEETRLVERLSDLLLDLAQDSKDVLKDYKGKIIRKIIDSKDKLELKKKEFDEALLAGDLKRIRIINAEMVQIQLALQSTSEHLVAVIATLKNKV